MPSQDGYDLIRKVRSRKREHRGLIPGLALTDYGSSGDAVRHAKQAIKCICQNQYR